MNHKSLKILSQSKLGFISMPCGHQVIHLCFNNLMINFTVDDFFRFRQIVKNIHGEQEIIAFPDGSQRILLHSPYDGINFSFHPNELNQLIHSLDEAYYMHQIYGYLD